MGSFLDADDKLTVDGLKILVQLITKDLDENHTELLQRIYDNRHRVHKPFDVSLSHSYGRQAELLEVKEYLNRQKLVVYVYWINDAEMLAREKQNGDTCKVLLERLRRSSSLLFIQTKQSVISEYCRKEFELFKRLNRTMYIIEADGVEELVPFYGNMTLAKQLGKGIVVERKDGEATLSKSIIDVCTHV